MLGSKAEVGAAAAVAAVAYPLLQTIGTNVKIWWNNYGTSEMMEIDQIRQLYRDFCYPHENNEMPNTLRVDMSDELEKNRGLPVHFQMKDDGKIKQPIFYLKQLRMINQAEDWNKHVSRDSFLSSMIKDMIGRICNYQIQRNKGILKITEDFGVGGKGYSYDPTNLFFEEFKMWLVELSKAPLNATTLNIVEGRMDYLRAIDVRQVFKQNQKTREVTRHKTVIRLLKDLIGGIQPMITTVIAAEGAREHFKKLTINLEAMIWETAKFCFYIFRDTPNTPEAFILDELKHASQNYTQVVKGTESGLLLYQLFNSPLVKLIEGGSETSDTPLLKLEFDQIRNRNTFITKEEGGRLNTGILDTFNQEDIMRSFYQLHGLIEKIYVFRKIAFDLYRLAGEGGNVLVYGYAAPQLRHVMNNYRTLLMELEVTVGGLHDIADNYRRSLIDQQRGLTKEEERWLRLFVHSDGAKEHLCHRRRGLLADSLQLVRKIEEKIDVVNTPAYIEKLQKDIRSFTQWMVLFTGEDLSAKTINIRQHELGDSDDSFVMLPAPERPVLTLQSSDKKLLRLQIGDNTIQFTHKKLNRNADAFFYAIERTREDSIRLLLEVCEKQPYSSYLRIEVQRVFQNNKLPLTFQTHSGDLFKQYNDAIDKKMFKDAEYLLDILCLKTPGFLSDYLQYRYIELQAGVPYMPKSSGMLHAMANLFKQNFYVLEYVENKVPQLVDIFECQIETQNPPVYLMYYPNLDPSKDFPHFDCLLNLKQLAITHSRLASAHGFFEVDENELLDRAQNAYVASQQKGLSDEDWRSSLRVAVECMNKLVDRYSKNPYYLMLRGKYTASMGEHAKRKLAINDFNTALEYCETDLNLRCQILSERGITYEYSNEIDFAIKDYSQILELAPDNSGIRLRRGTLLVEMKQDATKGLADFDYAIEQNKEDIEALKARFRAAMFLQEYSMATRDAMTMKRICPDDPVIENMVRETLFQQSKMST